MGIARGIRGPGRKALLQEHRLAMFNKVFSLYIDGKVGVDVVKTRAMKLKLLGRKRRRRGLPQRGDALE